MSHFSILVITDEKPTDDILHKIMLPWSEQDEDYFTYEDKTDEALKIWSTEDEDYIQGPFSDGSKSKSEYDNYFYSDPEGISFFKKDEDGHRNLVKEGFEIVTMPRKNHAELLGLNLQEDFMRFAIEYGYVETPNQPGKVSYFHNPNAKWDWFQIGGRYSGKLISKAGERGTVSLLMNDFNYKSKECDISQFKDIDFEAMRKSNVDKRLNWIQDAMKSVKEKSFARFEDNWHEYCRLRDLIRKTCKDKNISFREYLENNPTELTVIMFRAIEDYSQVDYQYDFSSTGSLQTWAESAPALSAWGFIKDGKWSEKAEMGWWGMHSEIKNDWDSCFNHMLSTIKPDQWIAVVDCHI